MKTFSEWLNLRDAEYFDETFRRQGGRQPIFQRQPGRGLLGRRRVRGGYAPSTGYSQQAQGGQSDDAGDEGEMGEFEQSQRAMNPSDGTLSPQQDQQFAGLSAQISNFDNAQKQKQAGTSQVGATSKMPSMYDKYIPQTMAQRKASDASYDPLDPAQQKGVAQYTGYDPLNPLHKEPAGYNSPIGANPYASKKQAPYRLAPTTMSADAQKLSNLFNKVNTFDKSAMYKIYDNNKAAFDAYAEKYGIRSNPWEVYNHLHDNPDEPKPFKSGLYQFTPPGN